MHLRDNFLLSLINLEKQNMCLLKTVTPDKASGQVKAIYTEIEKVFGKVPNVIQMFSVNPHFLIKQAEYLGYYGQHPTLTSDFNAYVRLLVSEMLNCEYCIRLNSALLRSMGVTDDELLAARKDFSKVKLDNKRKTLLLYVLKLVKDPHTMTEEELDKVRAEGWSDSEIFDASFHAANHSAFVKLVDTFKVIPDF